MRGKNDKTVIKYYVPFDILSYTCATREMLTTAWCSPTLNFVSTAACDRVKIHRSPLRFPVALPSSFDRRSTHYGPSQCRPRPRPRPPALLLMVSPL
ncbi:hypothetical protein IG631_16372 [Alternaria alternata]|nr:hypothetical protein IG631_16372 [Alternaria alternata]